VPVTDARASPPERAQYNVRIREMPLSDRPRERLRDHGAGALSNQELLAIILRTGSTRLNVINLASELLTRHGGLGGLARLSHAELAAIHGIGAAKAAELQAMFELGRRTQALQPQDRPCVRSPADVMGLVGAEMSLLDQEHMRVMLLNTRNQVLAVPEVYKGNVGSALVRPAELLRDAVRQNAPCLILVHNHPSGDPSPSPDDVSLTKQVFQAAALMGIELLDHVIVGDKRHASLKELGLGFSDPPTAPSP
jgi:DNA repair protein RadC